MGLSASPTTSSLATLGLEDIKLSDLIGVRARGYLGQTGQDLKYTGPTSRLFELCAPNYYPNNLPDSKDGLLNILGGDMSLAEFVERGRQRVNQCTFLADEQRAYKLQWISDLAGSIVKSGRYSSPAPSGIGFEQFLGQKVTLYPSDGSLWRYIVANNPADLIKSGCFEGESGSCIRAPFVVSGVALPSPIPKSILVLDKSNEPAIAFANDSLERD